MLSTYEKKIGHEIIKQYLVALPITSGVYQMFSSNNKCLYVGKAKNLKKRVINYTTPLKNSLRIQKMIAETSYMQHFLTNTEEDALLLEADLIKNLNPKYNILLRDDKTFPFIEIDLNHDFPRIRKIKTKDTSKANLFGPFANSSVVEETISLIQRTFKLRVCSDNNFKNRVKPCIYYQIKRCSAPCVQKITASAYTETVNNSIALLRGNSSELKQELANLMEEASNNNNFEKAIVYREQIKTLSQVGFNSSVILPSSINADFLAVINQQNTYCINVFMFRNGRSHGSLSYFPSNTDEASLNEVLGAFIMQFYKNHPIPNYIVCNTLPNDNLLISKALKILANTKINLSLPNLPLKPIMDFVINNTINILEKQLNVANLWQNEFNKLSTLFNFKAPIKRIEIYDNSHFKGSSMLGVMVCAKNTGFNTKEYRIFNLKDKTISSEDDYGMLREALTRRLLKLESTPAEQHPNLLLIDGGSKQLNVALEVLDKLNLRSSITVASIVKGDNRKYGAEKIILSNLEILDLADQQDTLKFLLKLRDEAHRFAITSQRKANLKKSTASLLDQIQGIGSARKKALLSHFGSVQNIKIASLKELTKVDNISTETAKKILEWLN